jgi:hypothetical protein
MSEISSSELTPEEKLANNPRWIEGRRSFLTALGVGGLSVGGLVIASELGLLSKLEPEIASAAGDFVSIEIGGESLQISADVLRKGNQFAELINLPSREVSAVVRASNDQSLTFNNNLGEAKRHTAFVEGYKSGGPQTMVFANEASIDFRTFVHEAGHTVCPFDNPQIVRDKPDLAAQAKQAFQNHYDKCKSEIRPFSKLRHGYPHNTENEMTTFISGMRKIGKLTWAEFYDTPNDRLEAQELNLASDSIQGTALAWVTSELERLGRDGTRTESPHMNHELWGMFVSKAIKNPGEFYHLKGYDQLAQYADQVRELDEATFYLYAREGFAYMFSNAIVDLEEAKEIYPQDLLAQFSSLYSYLRT